MCKRKMTAKLKLLLWLSERKTAKTSEAIRYALDNYSDRGDRNCRLLAEEGLIRRLSDREKDHIGVFSKEGVWGITEKGETEAKQLGQMKFSFV